MLSADHVEVSLWAAILITTFGLSSPALADPPALVVSVAREQGVPARVLWAVVRTESNSLTERGARPWPWTLNHRGKPLFFQSKDAALAYARSLISQGDQGFDIGLGQLNWRWHKQRFGGDPRRALEPRENLRAAAMVLKEQHAREDTEGWFEAAGRYHRPGGSSRDIEIAKAYALKVLEHWSQERL